MSAKAEADFFDSQDLNLYGLFFADLHNQPFPDGLTPSQALVLEHIGLAISIAADVYRRGVVCGSSSAEHLDILQSAITGLIRSVEGYDPLGGEFHRFAAPAIRGECWREVEMWMSPVRFAASARTTMRKAARVLHRTGNSVAGVAQELGVSTEKAENVIRWLDLEHVVSLEAPDRSSPECDGDDLTLADHIPDPVNLEGVVAGRVDFRRAWVTLTDDERRLLSERSGAEWGEGLQVNEKLAREFRVTPCCIRKRQRRARERLKLELEG